MTGAKARKKFVSQTVEKTLSEKKNNIKKR